MPTIRDPFSHALEATTATTSADVERRAVTGALLVARRNNASPTEVLEFLDMLGILDTASEIAGRPLATGPVALTRRDNIGRLRHAPSSTTQGHQEPPVSPSATDSAPANDTPDPIPAGRHGHNGRCASGDHPWVPENISVHTSGQQRCKPCGNRQKRGISTARTRDPEEVVLCRCPGRKHRLSAESSESTYVSPDGRRMCRVGIDRRAQAEKASRDVAAEREAS